MMCKFNKIKHKNVITCTEAVIERKISLKQELKTLLLDVNSRIIAVHIRGSDRLKIRNIKKIFKTKNIFFVEKEFLNYVNLDKGRINPWNINFCQYNLICLNIFNNKFMATNNGKFDEGIIFKTDELLKIENIILGKFAENK